MSYTRILAAKALGITVSLCLVGSSLVLAQTKKEPFEIVESDKVKLTYLLPRCENATNSSDNWEFGAPVVDGFSNPIQICYDKAYLEKYFEWALQGDKICGSGTYVIVTDKNVEIEVRSGLDEYYLGRKFKAADLIDFLELRRQQNSQRHVYVFDLKDAKKKLPGARRLLLSPWARDTCTVISLLAESKYPPAYKVIRQLSEDRNETVRYSAIMGLRHFLGSQQSAARELETLLYDPATESAALEALRCASVAPSEILARAINSDNLKLVNGAVFVLPWLNNSLADGEVAWNAALDHRNPKVRKWAMSALGDLCGRVKDYDLGAYKDILEKRGIDKNDMLDTRKAAIGLLKSIDK